MVNIPFILHPLEVAQILSTMTNDENVITAGILHDIVEDTDGTLSEIEKRFGQRVAFLVSSESETEYPGESKDATWQRRKEDSLKVLKSTQDQGVRMLWLADKLANIRSLAGEYSEKGEKIWESFHQRDPEMHRWYYATIAEQLELSLNKTGAFKELIKHINFIWPGTFDSEKARYRKYREVSVDGCRLIGRGAKGDVYRYDDELVIKVLKSEQHLSRCGAGDRPFPQGVYPWDTYSHLLWRCVRGRALWSHVRAGGIGNNLPAHRQGPRSDNGLRKDDGGAGPHDPRRYGFGGRRFSVRDGAAEALHRRRHRARG